MIKPIVLLGFMAITAMCLTASACKMQSSSEARAKVIGISYPAQLNGVVRITLTRHLGIPLGFGTGTIIGPRHVLTAYHVLADDGGLFGAQYIQISGAAHTPTMSMKYDRSFIVGNPRYEATKRSSSFASSLGINMDLAILILPDEVDPRDIAEIAENGVAVHDPIMIAGYGNTRINSDDTTTSLPSNAARKGYGRVSRFINRYHAIETVTAKPVGCDGGCGADGDSGGPIFNMNGKLVGTLKAGGPSRDVWINRFTNLHDASINEGNWMEAAGFQYSPRGYSGDEPNLAPGFTTNVNDLPIPEGVLDEADAKNGLAAEDPHVDLGGEQESAGQRHDASGPDGPGMVANR